MTVSIICGQQVDELETLERFARLCGPDGYHRLWLGQSLMLETFSALSALAGRGVQVPCGTAVSIAPLRTPYDAALQARSVAALMGQPVSVAFGLGTPGFAAMLNGGPLQRPGTASAEYVRSVRRLLDADEAQLMPLAAPPIEVGAGVLRPRMARKAGAVADFLVTWLAPLEHVVATLAPAAAAGAADAGRDGAPRTVCVLQVAVAQPDRQPYKLAYVGCGRHLQAEHYQAALRAAGMTVTGDLAQDVQELVHSGLFVYASVSGICDTIQRYHEAGVDEVVLNFSGVSFMHGLDAALTDAGDVAAALATAGVRD